MNVLIDRSGAARVRWTAKANGNRWYYCAAPPRLAIVRVDGMDLSSAIGRVADVQIGWDNGTAGFVHDANIGRRHTKITIRRVLPVGTAYQDTLMSLLNGAPKETE